jgi:hypothetical protein
MRFIVGILVAALLAGALIGWAPTARAGCIYGGAVAISRCDGPVQPDGTWQRCMVTNQVTTDTNGNSVHRQRNRCDLMGPDQHPVGLEFNIPPTHIDD